MDAQDNIHGVIDFGDSQKNPLVYDIAIAIMYMMTKVIFVHLSKLNILTVISVTTLFTVRPN